MTPEPTFTDPVTDMEFVYLESGKFRLDDSYEGEDKVENSQCEVTLDGFYIGKYPVTCGQWEKLMGTNPSKFNSGMEHPVEMVSWVNAKEFAEKLTEKNTWKYQFRLPTEAEWEYAARSRGKNEKYAGGDNIDDVAWYDGNSGNLTHPVGEKAPNGLGIHDMTGNVWEWCQDWFGDYPSNSANNPSGPSEGTQRVLRGGSWDSDILTCRTISRYRNWPENSDQSWGVRLVRDMAPPKPPSELSVADFITSAPMLLKGKGWSEEETGAQMEVREEDLRLEMNLATFNATKEEDEQVPLASPAEADIPPEKTTPPVTEKKTRKRKKTTAVKIVAVAGFLCLAFGLFFFYTNTSKKRTVAVKTSNETGISLEDTILKRSGNHSKEVRKPVKEESMTKNSLFIKTEPKDSRVRILNTKEKFQQGMTLKPGRYQMEVSRHGYNTKKRWITLKAEKSQTIEIQLEQQRCNLFVKTEPKDSRVRILNTKEKFQQGMTLKPGRYQMEVSRHGYNTKKGWITLKAGENQPIRIHLETSPVCVGSGRYCVYPNGAILDSDTGLEWLVGPDKSTTFPEAEKWLNTLNAGIQSAHQWKIPTIKELGTLYNKWKGTKRNMPKIFETTGWCVWARRAPNSSNILFYNFFDGKRAGPSYVSISVARAFAVRPRK